MLHICFSLPSPMNSRRRSLVLWCPDLSSSGPRRTSFLGLPRDVLSNITIVPMMIQQISAEAAATCFILAMLFEV